MGIINSNKELNKTTINCDETFNVTLSITGAPDIVTNPTDIVLILDKSGSMTGDPLTNLKLGAKKFVEIIDEATDGTQDGQIGNGSHIGIVSFSNTATQDTGLITSVANLNTAIDALVADGLTNHEDAFIKAIDLFDENSTNAKVIVMFTDGITTAGGNPVPVATQAKADGIIIYSIGLIGDNGIDVDAINAWSSEPSSAYVAITPDDDDLEELFEELARNISIPGATNIEITDTVDSCFKITNIVDVSKGDTEILADNVIKWTIDELGTTTTEAATLEFTLERVGNCTGTIEVNDNIEYEDTEGNIVTFPSPTIEVTCDNLNCIEGCPTPVDIVVEGCNDTIEYDAGDIYLDSLGRILELKATIKNVCPNRRVALAVIVTEVDANNIEHKRGIKTMEIPAHTLPTCNDIIINCIRFVLPESLDTTGNNNAICNARNFKARFIAHYIDNDFNTCNDII